MFHMVGSFALAFSFHFKDEMSEFTLSTAFHTKDGKITFPTITLNFAFVTTKFVSPSLQIDMLAKVHVIFIS